MKNKLVANIPPFQCAAKKRRCIIYACAYSSLSILRKGCILGQCVHPLYTESGWRPRSPLRPLLYYHESFVKLALKFGIVTSLRTNFAAEADELCSPGNKSLLLLLRMHIIVKIRKSRKSLGQG